MRGERVRHRVEVLPRALDAARQLVEDAPHLGALRELRFAQRVVRLEDLERLDEHRRAARGLVVDDPLHRAAHLGLHRHDVASAALRDELLLQRVGELRGPQQAVQALLEARLRRAERRAERAEARAGAVEHLAGAGDGVFDGLRDLARRPREARLRGERWVRMHVAEELLGRADRVRDLDQLLRIERAAQSRAPQRVADVARATESRGRLRSQEIARGGRLVLQPLGLADVGDRGQHLGQLAPGRERAALGEELADARELEGDEGAIGGARHRETPGEPRTQRRHGFADVALSAMPMRSPRAIVREARPRARRGAAAPSASRSTPECPVESAKARPSSPGPLRRAPSANPSSGSAPRRSTAPAIPRLMRDDVHAEPDAVREIDIGVSRPPEHDLGARRGAAERVRGGITSPVVSLDLDEPRGAPALGAIVEEHLAEEVARDGKRRARVERARKPWAVSGRGGVSPCADRARPEDRHRRS